MTTRKNSAFTIVLARLVVVLVAACLAITSSAWAEAVRVACVGDSITFGAGIAEREANCYPAQLEKFLGSGFEVRNFGVNGATMLKSGDKPYWKEGAFTAAKEYAPLVVVIALGTNDTKPQNWDQGSEKFADDYAAMVAEFAALPSKPEIYACLPAPAFPERWGIRDSVITAEVLPAVRELAKKAGIGLVDLNAELQGKGGLFPDQIHPNAGGAGIIARTVAASVLSSAAAAGVSDGFTPLFDGKTLDGWVNVNCAPGTWSVQDGMIHCTGVPTGAMRTVKQYENFVLELDWRHLKPAGNAGVFIWAGPVSAPGVPFLRAIEVQVLENAYGKTEYYTTHGDIFPIHGSEMTPDAPSRGSRSFPSEERSKPSPEWNHYRIVGVDGVLKLSVNGRQVSGGRGCDWRKGYLALESEGGAVDYRDLRIRELPSSGAPADQTAPEYAGQRPLYTGVDLSGWKAPENGGGWKANDWTLSYDGKGGGELWSDADYTDFELTFDWRLKEDSPEGAGGSVILRGKNGVPVSFKVSPEGSGGLGGAGNLPPTKRADQDPGKWNRFVITVKGKVVNVELNGTVVVDAGDVAPASGAIGFRPAAGAAFELAGIYVRKL